jgi:replicative DNA helicase
MQYNKRTIQPELSLMMGKLPPQATDMEISVLGGCMLEKEVLHEVIEILPSPDCFYNDNHQKVYGAILALLKSGYPIDLLTVTNELRKTGELETIGGAYFIVELCDSITSTANCIDHAKIVFQKYIGREVIRLSGVNINKIYAGDDPFEVMEDTQLSARGVLDGVLSEKPVTISDSFDRLLLRIDEQINGKCDAVGIPTGYPDLDRITLGLIPKELVIIGARPSIGKTMIAINIAMNVANSGDAVLFFSLESDDIPLTTRVAANRCEIPMSKIRTGNLDKNEEKKIRAAKTWFDKLDIKIESVARDMRHIISISKRWKKQLPAEKRGVIIVDYLQLMEVQLSNKNANREQEVSHMSRKLKELAMQLDVPVVALSQLNRGLEKQTNKKPQLSDLRESGAIEQDANQVWLPYKEVIPGYSDPVFQILVAKNREGQTGTIKFKENGDFQQLLSWDDSRPNIPSSGGFVRPHWQEKAENKADDWDNDEPIILKPTNNEDAPF